MDSELLKSLIGQGAGLVVAVLLIWRLEGTLDRTLGRLAKQIELNTIVVAQIVGLDIEAAKKRIANGRE